jgi:formamidase
LPLSSPYSLPNKTNKFPRTGGQIQNNDSADDVRNVDLSKVHYLSGPFEIEGAKPGDVLLVEIMDVQPFQDRPWGFTGIFDKSNGVCPPSVL